MPKHIEDPTGLVLEHANKILFESGYSNFSIRNVAQSCGISVGTIYNYFPTKNDLIMKLIQNHWQQYYLFLEAIDHEEIGLFQKLACIFIEFKTFTNSFRELWLKSVEQGFPCNLPEARNYKADFFKNLSQKIEQIIVNCKPVQETRSYYLTSKELSQFILVNFTAMAMAMPQTDIFDYECFEKILRKLTDNE
ncbi:MAG: TetR/AcrR family transcriptional regulator [Negativicutes bacterium]|jgi:AcrR family transcriptional regulator